MLLTDAVQPCYRRFKLSVQPRGKLAPMLRPFPFHSASRCHRSFSTLSLVLAAVVMTLAGDVRAQQPLSVPSFRLDSLEGLEPVNARAEIISYEGRRALHLAPLPDPNNPDESLIALISGTNFKDGTIELEVAGSPRAGATPDSRGFIGVMFRVQDHGKRGENIYLRPTNGRADDQLRRNHSTQYESMPDFPWFRLRKEAPGVYESYVDLLAGEWTRMKIVVSGTKAQLYVNGGDQPCLIVNDLKLGDTRGQIALWAHSSTDAYFSNLTITDSEGVRVAGPGVSGKNAK